MSILQITSCQLSLYVRNTCQSRRLSSKPYFLVVHAKHPLRNSMATCIASNWQLCRPILKNQTWRAASTYQHFPLNEMNGSDNEGASWKALENAMGNPKNGSLIEDVLRQQIEKEDFFEEGSSGATRGGGGGGGHGAGGGGGGGGGAWGSSGSEDESFAGIINEIRQVILATIGFVVLYVCIINGEDWTCLVKDYLKFLYSGSGSARLKRAMYKWRRFYQKLTKKKSYDLVEEGNNQYPQLGGLTL